MASVSMSLARPSATQNGLKPAQASKSFLKSLPVKPSNVAFAKKARFVLQASLKEKAVTGLTAAALTAAMVIPDVAEAAGPGISPSLKNFLLSIVAGGVVLGVIVGAVIAVANFDPVRRS